MFITFEGIEGSGKSTQAKMLSDYLTRKGIDNVLTREPGGTPVAEKIRELLLNNDLTNATELALILAARSDHCHNLIEPAIREGKWVICDRFIDSTYAYQFTNWTSTGMDMIIGHLEDVRIPHITFLLDISVNSALERIKNRPNNNKYDFKSESVYETIRDKYLDIYKKNTRIQKIDVENLSSDEVHAKILSYNLID